MWLVDFEIYVLFCIWCYLLGGYCGGFVRVNGYEVLFLLGNNEIDSMDRVL